ncbi:unnamed protein product [Dovyalis caffra]|uniref:Uncharacterized protein n=1 Tax=Dovyalis caffra TaxID=77055 RepID=A0AAV1RAJ5_9ROSI|nr:unnamed protein product [Dovyalis caffra]
MAFLRDFFEMVCGCGFRKEAGGGKLCKDVKALEIVYGDYTPTKPEPSASVKNESVTSYEKRNPFEVVDSSRKRT